MAVTVIVGTNSWITLAEADDYMDGKVEDTNWDSKTGDQKNRAIVSAFRMIYNSGKFNIPKTATAQIVKDAQSELADYLAEFYSSHKKRTALRAQGVNDFKVSKWEEKSFKDPEIPSYIVDMLDDYLQGVGGYFPTVSRDFNG